MTAGPDLQVVVSCSIIEYPGIEGGDTKFEKFEALHTRQPQPVFIYPKGRES